MTKCPECGSEQIKKNGIKRGKQNHICVKCGRQFVEHNGITRGYSDQFRRECLKMYVNGMGFKSMKNYLITSIIYLIFVCLNNLFIPKIVFAFNPEHLQKLLTTKECINCDLTGTDLSNDDLISANFSGSDLTGADLSNLDLTSSNLTNTKLKNANFSYSKLLFSDLTGADLTNANFTGAYLHGVNVHRNQILQANLKEAVLLGIDSLKPEDIDNLLKTGVTIDKGNQILAQQDDIFVSLQIKEQPTEKFDYQILFTLTKKNATGNVTIPLTLAPDFIPYPSMGQRLLVRIIDLDGDSIPEIIVDYFSGGAHCCSSSQIIRFSSFDDKDITYNWIKHDWFHTDYHLRMNLTTGLPEFFSYDNRFAYRFGSFAASRFPLQIWQYQQGKMIDKTRQYPKLLEKQTHKLLKEYEELLTTYRENKEFDLMNDTNISGIGGIFSAYLATKSLLNEQEEGWQTLEKIYQGKDKQEFFMSLKNFLQVTGYIPNSTITNNLMKSITTAEGIATEEGRLLFNNNGDILIWTLPNGGLHLWDWQKGESKGKIVVKDEILTPMTVSNEDVILILSELKLIKWDLKSGKIQPWQGNNNQDYLDLTPLLVEQNRTILASQIITNAEGKEETILVISENQYTDEKHRLTIYAPESNQTLKTLEIKERVSAVFLDYDRRILAYSTNSSNIYLMNIDTAEILSNFNAGDNFSEIKQIGVHENTLVTIDNDNKLQIWDITSNKFITSWLTNALNLAIHPEGKVFATTNGYESNVQLWRLPFAPSQKTINHEIMFGNNGLIRNSPL